MEALRSGKSSCEDARFGVVKVPKQRPKQEVFTANIGFVGLGVMGSRMAQRLLDAGHQVTGYNRTKSKAQSLIDAGMKWGDTPRAVAAKRRKLRSRWSPTPRRSSRSQAAPDGILAGLSSGKIYIDMSTVSPAASRAVAEQVKAKGAEMLDAPVSGSVITLEEGKLSIMAAGDRAGF